MINKGRVIVAGIFGNALEWYDFTTYAFFAYLFAALFFPMENQYSSLLLTFGVFALSFLVRPFGGVLMGLIGDRFGRLKALIISMVLMTIPTLLIAFLPDYRTAGIIAPILLTLLRILQGIAVSGELTSATSYLVEHASPNQRGFAGSLVMCSAFIGIAGSSAVVALVTELTSTTQLFLWGWRLPFVLGGILGIAGLIIRLRSQETLHFKKIKLEAKNPLAPSLLKLLFTDGAKSILLAILLVCVMATSNYYLIGFFTSFLIKFIHLPSKGVALINFIALGVFTVLIPIAGIVSDKIGRKPVMGFGIVAMLLLALPIFQFLTHGSLQTALIAQVLFAVCLAPIAGLVPTMLAEMFVARIRNTGLSIGYNVSLAIFGGTAPLIALALVETTGKYFSPALYLIACSSISLIAWYFVRETYKQPLP